MTSRRHTVIHEAGHAVVGRVITLLHGMATIASGDEFGSYGVGIRFRNRADGTRGEH